MDKITREQFQSRLQDDWRCFVERFRRLSPDGQAAFLEKQGYAALGDLLAHVIGWWQDGAQTIGKMRADPGYPLAHYDVDAFNARAVEQFRGSSESAMVQAFESQRQVMLDLVTHLSAAELDRDNINTRLYYEIIMHWKEHEIV